MSASPISIAVPTTPGAPATGPAGGGVGALAGFEALMNAFFASTQATLETTASTAAAAGQPQVMEAATPLSPGVQWGRLGEAAEQGAGAPQPSAAPAEGAPAQPTTEIIAQPSETPQPLQVALATIGATPDDAATRTDQPAKTEPGDDDSKTEAATGDAAPSALVMSLLAPAQAQAAVPTSQAAPVAESGPPAAARTPDLPPPMMVEPDGAPAEAADTPATPQPLAQDLTRAAPRRNAERAPAQAAASAQATAPAAAAAPPSPAVGPQAPAPQAAASQAAVPQAAAPPPEVEAQAGAQAEAQAAPQPQPERPTKPVRAAREQTQTAANAAPTPEPRTPATAAAPAGTATPQPGADKAARPDIAGMVEAKPADAAPQADAQPPLAEAAPAPAAATSSAHAPATPVRGAPETVASLAAQIVKKLGARTTQFDLQLDPAGLGRVNVRVAINADGRLSAAMSFDNPQAAADLKARANELQRALAQSGFDLSGGLSFDVTQDRGNPFAGQQQNPFLDEQREQAFRGRAFAAAMDTAGEAADAALSSARAYRRATPAGVDVRI